MKIEDVLDEPFVNQMKEFEGFRENEYICLAGIKTIGYGSTNLYVKNITKEKAELFLRIELIKLISYFISLVNLTLTLTKGQIKALTSLVYNWGMGNFLKSKGFKYLIGNNFKDAEREFFSKRSGVVNIKGKFSKGLYKRRQKELEWWLS